MENVKFLEVLLILEKVVFWIFCIKLKEDLSDIKQILDIPILAWISLKELRVLTCNGGNSIDCHSEDICGRRLDWMETVSKRLHGYGYTHIDYCQEALADCLL
jgi:hypothetical protein